MYKNSPKGPLSKIGDILYVSNGSKDIFMSLLRTIKSGFIPFHSFVSRS